MTQLVNIVYLLYILAFTLNGINDAQLDRFYTQDLVNVINTTGVSSHLNINDLF